MILLQHLNIWVIRQALLANGREIGRLPAASVQILLNLGRHIGGEVSRYEAKSREVESRQSGLDVCSVSGVSEYAVVGAQRVKATGL
jgi:hypothetical protein